MYGRARMRGEKASERGMRGRGCREGDERVMRGCREGNEEEGECIGRVMTRDVSLIRRHVKSEL